MFILGISDRFHNCNEDSRFPTTIRGILNIEGYLAPRMGKRSSGIVNCKITANHPFVLLVCNNLIIVKLCLEGFSLFPGSS